MPFVQGKCESCGGILTVDPSLKAANCPFCGAAYVVQDSINYYNTTIKVDSLHADVVNLSDERSSEGRLKAADAHMKLGHYDKAEVEYKKVTELAPQNYRGWLGLIEVYTRNYSKRIRSATELKNIAVYARNIEIITNQTEDKDVLRKYTDYINSEKSKNTNELNDYETLISQQNHQKEELEEQRKTLVDESEQIRKQISGLRGSKRQFITAIVLFVLGAMFLCDGFLFISISALYKNNIVEYIESAETATPDEMMIAGAVLAVCGLVMVIIGIVFKIKSKPQRIEAKKLAEQLKEIGPQIDVIDKKTAEVSSKINSLQMEMKKYV